MLSWSEILRYIKSRTALPSGFFEVKDEELINYLKENALRDFSNYFPDSNRIPIKTDDPEVKHPTMKSAFLIKDPENLDILSLVICYFPEEELTFLGHPVSGVTSMEGLKNWALGVFRSRFLLPFSVIFYTYTFIPPNIIRFDNEEKKLPRFFVAEYERLQPPDLRRIPGTLYQEFKDLCLAHTLIYIGSIRTMYGDGRINTPFGDIPLNGAELLNRGEELRNRILDNLADMTAPNIILDTY